MSANFPGARSSNMPGMGPLPPVQDRMMNPAYTDRAAEYNAQQLAQVLAILQANPAFLPNRMTATPAVLPQGYRPGQIPANMTPQRIQPSIRQPIPGQTVVNPAMRAYTPVYAPPAPAPAPQRTFAPMPAPSMATQNRLQPKLVSQLRPTK